MKGSFATYLILTFDNTHMVLKAEKILLSQKLKHDIIPTPKDLSADCGMAIRFNKTGCDPEKLKSMLIGASIPFRMHER